MSHPLPTKRALQSKAKRARKAAPADPQRDSVKLPAPWATALARVKKHIQTESRTRGSAI